MSNTTLSYTVRTVDAWKDENGGWVWNNSIPCGEIKIPDSASNREIFKRLRDANFLTNDSKGTVYIEEFGERDIEIRLRSNDMPILALMCDSHTE